MIGKPDGRREMYFYNIYNTFSEAKRVASWHRKKGRRYKIVSKRDNCGNYYELWINKFIKLPWEGRW